MNIRRDCTPLAHYTAWMARLVRKRWQTVHTTGSFCDPRRHRSGERWLSCALAAAFRGATGSRPVQVERSSSGSYLSSTSSQTYLTTSWYVLIYCMTLTGTNCADLLHACTRPSVADSWSTFNMLSLETVKPQAESNYGWGAVVGGVVWD